MVPFHRILWSSAFLGLLVVVGGHGAARADGKFYVLDDVPPGVPYQRALLVFDGETETLLIQSRYAREDRTDTRPLGWVVPVPEVPALATLPAQQASYLFGTLGRLASPREIHVGMLLLALVFLVGAASIVLTLLAHVTPLFRSERRQLRWASLTCVVLFFALVATGVPGVMLGATRLTVLHEQTLGIYDVAVVRSDDPGALIAWLDERGFQHEDADQRVFQSYIDRGWCFVAARVDPTRAEGRDAVGPQGLAAPLVLRFASERPIYPLALTGTAGSDTDLDLYVLAPHRMEAPQGLTLRYAGEVDPLRPPLPREAVEPEGFYETHRPYPAWLTKLDGRLAPAAMQQDLLLAPAAEDTAHGTLRLRW